LYEVYLPWTILDSAAQLVYEATVMERSPLSRFLVFAKIRYEYFLVSVHDLISVLGDRVYAVETMSEAKLGESLDTAWLKKLSDDAIWLCHISFNQNNSSSLLGESLCQRAADDSCSDNNGICIIHRRQYQLLPS
jgi:hypothetical protein